MRFYRAPEMSLAIVERQPKQQRRPGGFAGIFFRLLDWNRRFSRKKLFPRKHLPPVRAAKAPAANNFVADVKMPLGKFLLVAGSIDDESQAGGFPSASKSDVDLGRGMRAPGLVARLMGLDSMPVSAHATPGASTGSGCFGKTESGRDLHRLDRELRVEDGRVPKLETRPQKLQKTGGVLERQPIDGVRAKQCAPGKKNALPSPSKIKLHSSASSVKSPRQPSDRLTKAASKILEPGLKPRSRTKSEITCSDSSPLDTSGIHVITSLKECIDAISPPGIESSINYESLGGTFRSELSDQEPVLSNFGSSGLEFRNASCSRAGFLEDSLTSLVTQGEQIREKKTHKHAQAKISLQNNVKDLAEKSNTNTSKSNLNEPSTMLARNQLRRNQSTTMKGTVAFGSKVSPRKQVRTASSNLNDMKNSVSVDKISSNYIRVKSSNEENNHQKASGNNTFDKNITRKRTINSFTIENAGTFSSICAKQSSGCDFIREQTRHTRVRSVCRRSLGSNSVNDNANEFSFRNDNIFAFTFNMKVGRASTSSSYNQMERGRSRKNVHHNDIGTNTLLALDKHGNTTSYKGNTLKGDELSNLLDQKIRELSSMDEDALLTRNARSVSLSPRDQETALIYQQNGQNHFSGSSKKADTYSNIDIFSVPIPQTKSEAALGPEPSVHDIDNSQLSPFSILEASFSNDSSSFASLIASSGEKLQFGLTESCNTIQSTNLDIDLSDSATSIDLTRSFTNKMQYFTDMSPRNLATHCDEVGFSNFRLCEARHLISNAALLSENSDLCRLDDSAVNSLESFLSDMFQALADALHFDLNPDSIKPNETDQLKRLIFDCMIEYMDSKFSCWNSGCVTYCRIPFLLTQEQMMIEVYKEIKEWMDLAGKFLNDLIKNEIKSSTETWTYCETEAYEAGIEINSQILENLVEELLIDFF